MHARIIKAGDLSESVKKGVISNKYRLELNRHVTNDVTILMAQIELDRSVLVLKRWTEYHVGCRFRLGATLRWKSVV